MNREEGAMSKMLLQSQVVTAFGRRLFVKDELKETSLSSDDEKSSGSKSNVNPFKVCYQNRHSCNSRFFVLTT